MESVQGLSVSTSTVGSRGPVLLQAPCSPDPFPLLTAVFSFLPAQGSGPPPGAPVLALRFSYICPDRQLRRYVVLEPEAQEAIQVMESRGRWEVGREQVQAGGIEVCQAGLHAHSWLLSDPSPSGATRCTDPIHQCERAAAWGGQGPTGGQIPVSAL